MKTRTKKIFAAFLLIGLSGSCQTLPQAIAKIDTEGFQKSQVIDLIIKLLDVYVPRLTGKNQYFTTAEWAKKSLEKYNVDKVQFENYCEDCMGWEVKSFNVEMVSPTYIKTQAYPYAWTHSSNGVQIGDLVWIENHDDMKKVKKEWSGKLKGKTILLGAVQKQNMLLEPLSSRFSTEQLQTALKSIVHVEEKALGPSSGNLDLVKDFELIFKMFTQKDDAFFAYLKTESAISTLGTTPMFPGGTHPGGTYNFREKDDTPIPIFQLHQKISEN
jgi:carboxypeptidase Q